MGNTFSNISVMKSESVSAESVQDFIVTYMKTEGIILSDIASDGLKKIIIRNNPDSKWLTIYDDNDDSEFSELFSLLLSKKFNTYTMSIINMDSDFMKIQLSSCGKKKDVVIIGEPYDDMLDFPVKKTHGKIDAWKQIAIDPINLVEAFKINYIYSEDVLVSLQKETCVSASDTATYFDCVEKANYDIVLYHSTESSDSDFIRNSDTIIDSYNSFGYICRIAMNKPSGCYFINRGGISKGTAVIITGSFIKNSDTVIEEITLWRGKNMNIDFFYGGNTMIYNMKTEKRVNAENGEPYITAIFPDFEFPEGLHVDCRTLNGPHLQIAERRHLMSVGFLPSGSPEIDLSDMVVLLRPLD